VGATSSSDPAALRLGVVVGPLGDARNAAAIAGAAEEAGFDLLGFGDNQSLWRDVYVSLSMAAAATGRIRLGPCVTNPLTRHSSVTAGAIATIDEISGGRAFLGLGPGDSSVLNAGLRPARLLELEEAVAAIRSAPVPWSARRPPIFLAAEGPRGLALAGRVADGALVSNGLRPDDVAGAERCIADAARAAGRAPADVEVWHAARVSVAASEEEAQRNARTGMASVAHHALRISPESRGVPSELVPALAELNAHYRPAEHARAGDSFNAQLVERLGLMPYLLSRYALAGTPEQCGRRVAALARAGVRRLLLMFAGSELESQVRRWREEVMPFAVAGGGR
jgi:5,10-methylenetetrahydromethanopterin reductase